MFQKSEAGAVYGNINAVSLFLIATGAIVAAGTQALNTAAGMC